MISVNDIANSPIAPMPTPSPVPMPGDEYMRARNQAMTRLDRAVTPRRQSIVPGPMQRLHRGVPYQPQTLPSGAWETVFQSNILLTAGRAVYDQARDRAWQVFGELEEAQGRLLGGTEVVGFLQIQDREIDAASFLKSSGLEGLYTEDEIDYIGRSTNRAQMQSRMRDVLDEKRELMAMSQLSFGEVALFGLIGAVTDPTSYVPILGQVGKGETAASTINALRVAKGASGARKALALKGLAADFRIAAAEGMALEASLQAINYANTINDDQFIAQAAPSIAITGAFAGTLGSAIGARRIPGDLRRLNELEASAVAHAEIEKLLVNRGLAIDKEAQELAARMSVRQNQYWVPPEIMARWESERSARIGKLGEDARASLIIEETMARTLNRPDPNVIPDDLDSAVQTASARSAVEAIDEVTKAKSPNVEPAKIAKAVAEQVGKLARGIQDAKIGMARTPVFIREAMGRGIVGLSFEKGVLHVKMSPRADVGDVVMQVKVGRMEDAPEGLRSGKAIGAFTATQKPASARVIRVSEDGTIFVNEAGVRKWWSQPKEIPLPDGSGGVLLRPIHHLFKDVNEFTDHVVMHELMHGIVGKSKKLKAEYDAIEGYNPKEAFINDLVMRWKEASDKPGGPEGREDITYYMADEAMPANESLPVREGQSPAGQLRSFWRGLGVGQKFGAALEWWVKRTSPVARGGMSESTVLRTVQTHLISGPFYYEGVTPDGGNAQVRTRHKWTNPGYKVLQSAEAKFKQIRRKEGRRSDKFDALQERLVDAMSVGNDKDLIRDVYSPIIDEAAGELRYLFDRLYAEMKRYGGKDVVLPGGETWFGRIYDNQRVRSREFLDMLMEHDINPDNALLVQAKILNYGRPTPDDLVGDARGNFDFGRGDVLQEIPYASLRPFLDRQGFRVAIQKLKTMGSELEYRRSMEAAARLLSESGIEVGPLRATDADGNVSFSSAPLINAMRREFAELSKIKKISELPEPDDYVAQWEEDFGDTVLTSLFPEVSKRLYIEAVEAAEKSRSIHPHVASELEFAEKWMRDMIKTVRFMRDIPRDADSFFWVRAPKLVKDVTHTLVSGGMALANVADFHRSVAERGFMRTFKDEWTLFMRDADAWAKRREMTEEIGLALETQRGEVQRTLRNASEHTGEVSMLEDYAARGAQLMSKLNLMGQVTDIHQRTISSGVQSFIIDNVPKLVNGTISRRDALQLERLGIDLRWAKRLNQAFDAGAVKKTKAGTKYFDLAEGWADYGDFGDLARVKQAIDAGVETTQTVPTRQELYDWQVQGWSSVAFMYRNWVMAANARLAASVLSNPNAYLMSGLVASIGLGGLVVAGRAAINNDFEVFKDPAEFFRRSLESGGYMGMVTEGHAVMSRLTAGHTDILPGDGGTKFYTGSTALSAIAGPAWKYADFLHKGTADVANLRAPDRYDVERWKGMVPFANLFYIDALWNRLAQPERQTPDAR